MLRIEQWVRDLRQRELVETLRRNGHIVIEQGDGEVICKPVRRAGDGRKS